MYEIIQTGSNGNAVIYNNDIMVDCGVPFCKIKPYYKDIKLLLLTHQHSDHFNSTTIKKLIDLRPTLHICCGEWLVQKLVDIGVPKKNIVILELDKEYDFGKYIIIPFFARHDVPNCGYKIIIKATNYKIFHATDINTLENIQARNYDLYCLESNYIEEELKARLKEKEEKGEYAYENRVIQTHLSKTECDRFLIANMGDNSECIYLHQHIDKDKKGEETNGNINI